MNMQVLHSLKVFAFWFSVSSHLFMKLSRFFSIMSDAGVVKQRVAPQSPSARKTNPNSVEICLDHSEPFGNVLITLCVAWKRSSFTTTPGNIDWYWYLTLQQSSTMTVCKGLSKQSLIDWRRSLISSKEVLFVSLHPTTLWSSFKTMKRFSNCFIHLSLPLEAHMYLLTLKVWSHVIILLVRAIVSIFASEWGCLWTKFARNISNSFLSPENEKSESS